MGAILSALDPGLNRQIAIKVLTGAESTDATRRFVAEARFKVRFPSPNQHDLLG